MKHNVKLNYSSFYFHGIFILYENNFNTNNVDIYRHFIVSQHMNSP